MTNTITKITLDGNDYEVGTGNVVGPSSATDGNLAAFDGATGKLIKDGGVLNTKAFYLSSSSDITTAQAAYDWQSSGKTAIVIYNEKPYIYSWSNAVSMTFACFLYEELAEASNDKTSLIRKVVTLSLSSSTVTSISVNAWNNVMASVIKTDTNYSTPYTPQYAGSPATKKYIDDKITVSSSAPATPIQGMLWYDTTNDALKTYDGNQWNTSGGGGDVQVSTQANNILTTGMKIWAGTDANYANLGTYDNNTLYLTIE